MQTCQNSCAFYLASRRSFSSGECILKRRSFGLDKCISKRRSVAPGECISKVDWVQLSDDLKRQPKGQIMTEKSSRVVLRDDMIFTGYSSNGYSIPLDTTVATGGHQAGISPMELMLTSVGGCMAMDVISILRKKQQQITGMEVQVTGTRADEHPKVYTDIRLHFLITGHQVDPKAVDRSIELSSTKYCAAVATLSHTAAMHYTYELIEAVEEHS
jgi:putative redox protein